MNDNSYLVENIYQLIGYNIDVICQGFKISLLENDRCGGFWSKEQSFYKMF